MQTFVVLVLAIAYGPKLGFLTGALYLLEGALGLPVFATGGGAAYLLGPTGGYLFGFVIAMSVVGFLVSKGWGQTALSVMGVMLIGEIIIFSLGVGWLSGAVGFSKAISLGLAPFLLAEAFKVVLAVVTVPLVWRALKR
jgi:biotin transport system substrate-specific component